MKTTKGNLVVVILLLFFTQSKSKWFFVRQFLIQTDNSFHKTPPLSFMYMLLFIFQKHTILNTDWAESVSGSDYIVLLPILI